MSLRKLLIEGNNLSAEQFKKDPDSVARKMGYEGDHAKSWVIATLSSIFITLFENEMGSYDFERLNNYLPALKEFFPYSGKVYRVLTIDIMTFNQLYSVIKNKFTDEQKENFRVLVKYGHGEIQKSKEVEEAFKNAVKLYLENTREFQKDEFDSWTKSLNGAKYFKQHQHGNHNVIISGTVSEGIDLLTMVEFINEFEGKNAFGAYYEHTKKVEEVVSSMPERMDVVESRVLKKKKKKPKQTNFL